VVGEVAVYVRLEDARVVLVVEESARVVQEPDVDADFRFGREGSLINATVEGFSPTDGRTAGLGAAETTPSPQTLSPGMCRLQPTPRPG
jgi:hypothetical protein